MNTDPALVLSLSLLLLTLLHESTAAVQKVTVTSGSTVTFYCPPYSYTVYRCTCDHCYNCWRVSDVQSKPKNYQRGYNFTVPHSTTNDSGCYTCDKWRCKFHLNLKVHEEKDPSVVIGKLGGSVVMPCALGKGISEKYWCREDRNGKCLKEILTPDPWHGFHIQDPQGAFSLEKRNLRPEDSGRYQCVVNKTHAIDLQVLQNDLSAPDTVTLTVGQQTKITCKYIQEYLYSEKSWQCDKQLNPQGCRAGFEVEDDRTRSELVLSIAQVSVWDHGSVYRCNVSKSSVTVKLSVGLSAPRYVNGTKGGNVTISCEHYEKNSSAEMFWTKLDFDGSCVYYRGFMDNHAGRARIKKYFSYFDVIFDNLEMKDSGSYCCGYIHWDNYHWVKLSANVDLLVTEPTIPPTTSVVTAKKTVKNGDLQQGATIGSNPLLYVIICLLAAIAVSLLTILLTLYCRRRKGRVQSPDLAGGTFFMSDLRSDLPNSTPQQPYMGCMDDSSSTSSESSGHSFGNISCPQHPYLSIIPSPKDADYENVPEEMPCAPPDYENMGADTEQDYVNISEPQNTVSTGSQDSETPRGRNETIAGRKNSSSGESSSSDETDEELVNYSMVVFKKATE